MKIKSTLLASAASLALGSIVVNSSAAPLLASAEPSTSHFAQPAAGSESVEAKPVARVARVTNAVTLAALVLGGNASDSTPALAATSDALFDSP